MGLNVIIWEELLSSGANFMVWDEILSSGMKCYLLGGDVIIWSCSACLSCLPIVRLHFTKVIFLCLFHLFLPICLPLPYPCLKYQLHLSDVWMPFGTKLRSSECFSLLRNGSGTEFPAFLSSAEWFWTEFRVFSVLRKRRKSDGMNQHFRLFRVPRDNFFLGKWQS
jgi:hypothetical protein